MYDLRNQIRGSIDAQQGGINHQMLVHRVGGEVSGVTLVVGGSCFIDFHDGPLCVFLGHLQRVNTVFQPRLIRRVDKDIDDIRFIL